MAELVPRVIRVAVSLQAALIERAEDGLSLLPAAPWIDIDQSEDDFWALLAMRVAITMEEHFGAWPNGPNATDSVQVSWEEWADYLHMQALSVLVSWMIDPTEIDQPRLRGHIQLAVDLLRAFVAAVPKEEPGLFLPSPELE